MEWLERLQNLTTIQTKILREVLESRKINFITSTRYASVMRFY